jgi:hypothetical protein
MLLSQVLPLRPLELKIQIKFSGFTPEVWVLASPPASFVRSSASANGISRYLPANQ